VSATADSLFFAIEMDALLLPYSRVIDLRLEIKAILFAKRIW